MGTPESYSLVEMDNFPYEGVVRKLGNDTFTSCQSIIITVTYGPGTLT